MVFNHSGEKRRRRTLPPYLLRISHFALPNSVFFLLLTVSLAGSAADWSVAKDYTPGTGSGIATDEHSKALRASLDRVEYRVNLVLRGADESTLALEAGLEEATGGDFEYVVSPGTYQRLIEAGLDATLLGGKSTFVLGEQSEIWPEESSATLRGGTADKLSSSGDPVAKDIGDFFITSGTVDEAIPDQSFLWRWVRNSSGAPAGTETTLLEYEMRIHNDNNPSNIWCGDFEIYLSSTASGGAVPFFLVYDNLGARTDGGFDDDTEDDSDIYLNWRTTTQFNGEDPNQQWYVYIRDTIGSDTGFLEYIQFTVNWETSDDYPNTCPGDLISVNATYSGDIETGGDVDFFRFSATAGTQYVIATTPGTLADTVLTLYDSTCTFIEEDDDSGDGFASQIVWTSPATATYNIRVKGFSSSMLGTYEVSVTEALPVDLTPYQQSNWDDKIPIGITQLSGTDAHTYSGPYESDQTLYFNRASLNQGESIASGYTIHFEVANAAGTIEDSWDWPNTTTQPGFFNFLTTDQAVGPLPAGSHTFKVWVDYTDAVAESDETNNFYQRTIVVESIAGPPIITSHPASQTVDPGDSVSFTVVATGAGPLSYQWRKDGGAISGATSATYTIASAQPGDAGSYDCVVANSAGSVTSDAAVLVVNSGGGGNLTPDPPTGLRGDAGSGEVFLRWDASDDPDVVGYTVWRGANADQLFQIGPDLVDENRYLDTDIESGDIWTYAVKAVNSLGESSGFSDTVEVQTQVVVVFVPDVSALGNTTARIPINVVNNSSIRTTALSIELSYPVELVNVDYNIDGFTQGVKVERTAVTRDYPEPIVNIDNGRVFIGTFQEGALRGEGHMYDVLLRIADAELGASGPLILEEVVISDSNADPVLVSFGAFDSFLTVSADCVLGDLDGNGDVQITDAVRSLLFAVKRQDPDECEAQAGDINGDGRLDSADAILILRMAAGIPINPGGDKLNDDDRLEPKSRSGSITVSIDEVVALPGSLVSLSIQISDAQDLAGADFVIKFPVANGVLVLDSVEVGDLAGSFENFTIDDNDEGDGTLRVSFGSESGLSGGQGSLVVLNFQIAASADLAPLVVELAEVKLSAQYGDSLALDSTVIKDDGIIDVRSFLPNDIRGTVLEADTGFPIFGAQINLDGTEFGATSDANGDFAVSELPDGTYTISVNADGFDEEVQIVQVSGGQSIFETFRLAPTSEEGVGEGEGDTVGEGSPEGIVITCTPVPGAKPGSGRFSGDLAILALIAVLLHTRRKKTRSPVHR